MLPILLGKGFCVWITLLHPWNSRETSYLEKNPQHIEKACRRRCQRKQKCFLGEAGWNESCAKCYRAPFSAAEDIQLVCRMHWRKTRGSGLLKRHPVCCAAGQFTSTLSLSTYGLGSLCLNMRFLVKDSFLWLFWACTTSCLAIPTSDTSSAKRFSKVVYGAKELWERVGDQQWSKRGGFGLELDAPWSAEGEKSMSSGVWQGTCRDNPEVFPEKSSGLLKQHQHNEMESKNSNSQPLEPHQHLQGTSIWLQGLRDPQESHETPKGQIWQLQFTYGWKTFLARLWGMDRRALCQQSQWSFWLRDHTCEDHVWLHECGG